MSTLQSLSVLVAQSCLTLCDSMDCIPPGSSVHGILQARILEWVAISFSRDSSQPKDQIQISRIAGRLFTVWATRKAHWIMYDCLKMNLLYLKLIFTLFKLMSIRGWFLIFAKIDSEKVTASTFIYLSSDLLWTKNMKYTNSYSSDEHKLHWD